MMELDCRGHQPEYSEFARLGSVAKVKCCAQ